MTHEELRAQFTFLRQVAAGPVVTHYARDPSGRFVMLHLLDGVPPAARAGLVESLSRLSGSDRAHVLQRLEVDGVPVIVTEYLKGFTTFPAWLESRAGPLPFEAPATIPPAAAEPPPATAASPTAPGEFTRLFGPRAAGDAPLDRPAPSPTNKETPKPEPAPFDPGATTLEMPPSAKPIAPTPPERGDVRGGEPPATEPVTIVGRIKTPHAPPQPTPHAKPVVRWREEKPVEPEPAAQPVVRWKGPQEPPSERPPAPAPPHAPPTSAPPVPAPPRAPSTSAPPRTPPAATPPDAPARKPPGEFTRIFGAADSGPSASSVATPPVGPVPPPVRESAPPPAPPPVAQPPAQTPGEFTRMFRPSPPPASTPPPSAPRPSDYVRALHDTSPARREPEPPRTPSGPPAPPPPAASSVSQPGEFTRLMAGVPATPSSAPPPPAAGSFTQIVSPQSPGASRSSPAPAPPIAGPTEAEDEPEERRSRTTIFVAVLAALVLAAVLLVLLVTLT